MFVAITVLGKKLFTFSTKFMSYTENCMTCGNAFYFLWGSFISAGSLCNFCMLRTSKNATERESMSTCVCGCVSAWHCVSFTKLLSFSHWVTKNKTFLLQFLTFKVKAWCSKTHNAEISWGQTDCLSLPSGTSTWTESVRTSGTCHSSVHY